MYLKHVVNWLDCKLTFLSLPYLREHREHEDEVYNTANDIKSPIFLPELYNVTPCNLHKNDASYDVKNTWLICVHLSMHNNKYEDKVL